MMNCWQNEPQARPSFNDLTKQLKDMENQHKVRLSLPSDGKTIARLFRANVCKNQAISKFRGHSQKIIFPHILVHR